MVLDVLDLALGRSEQLMGESDQRPRSRHLLSDDGHVGVERIPVLRPQPWW